MPPLNITILPKESRTGIFTLSEMVKLYESALQVELSTAGDKLYTIDQLNDALIDVDDLMARAALPYFLVGVTAKQIVAGEKLLADGLHIGIRRNELVPTALSTINTHQPELHLTGQEDGFMYWWNGTPIYVHYLDPENELFKKPDHVWYNAWEYQIPNPFKEYLATL